MSCFGLAIHLTQAEKAKLSEIVNTALYTAALINDCHSWPKELKHHLDTQGSKIPFNAVCILMQQYECSDAEAVERLRETYVRLQERHLSLVKNLIQREGAISDVHRKYIMAAQYAASGSEFWSIFAPRYPTKKELNQPECVLVDDVFKWKHNLTNDNQDKISAVLVDKTVAIHGAKLSQIKEAISHGIPSPALNDNKGDRVDGARYPDDSYISSTNCSCDGAQSVLSDDVRISTYF